MGKKATKTEEVQILDTQSIMLVVDKRYLALKKQVEDKAAELDAIVVSDDNTYARKAQSLAELNTVIKTVDKERLAISKPYRDLVDQINEAGKNITLVGSKSITSAKSEIQNYDMERLRKKAEEEARIKAEQQRVEMEFQEKQKRKQMNIYAMQDWAMNTITEIGQALSIEELQTIRKNRFELFPAAPKEFPDLEDIRTDLMAQIDEIGREKAKAIRENKSSDLLSTKEAVEAVMDIVHGEMIEMAEAKAPEVVGSEPTNSGPMISYRTSWDFEVADLKAIPTDWLIVDQAKVKSFLYGLKAIDSPELRHDNVINGIRIKKVQTPISPSASI